MRKDFNITDPGTSFPPTAKIILIPRDINEKLEQVMGRAKSCSQLHNASLSKPNSEATKVISVTDFFYDDPTMPYVALPDHKLDQSPCCPIISIKGGYYYCRSILK